jgi:hypothetical protein
MAAGNTYTQISSQTLASAATGLSLSGFGGYTDLRIVVTFYKGTSSGDFIQFNNSSTGYEGWYLHSFSSSNPSPVRSVYYTTSPAYTYGAWTPFSTSVPSFYDIYIPYYSTTSTYKYAFINFGSTVSGPNNPGQYREKDSNQIQWKDTSAITSVYIYSGANSFAAGTRVDVYGITEA